MNKRLNWIDQARGFSIFLVVYGHNFPSNEPYIYSFHVSLFFFIAGMFHPKKVNYEDIRRRAKIILIPYFFWAAVLYLFWLFIGRNYGQSATTNASPLDNFLGIFYAQGGQGYMDWGIPLWFLPCIFLVFLFFSAIQRIANKALLMSALILLAGIGFTWPSMTGLNLPWSLDVAMVACGFYGIGSLLKSILISLSKTKTALLFVGLLVINIAAFFYNPDKIDMYRSVYGNEALFFISGLSGSIAYLLFFKLVPVFRFLSYLGRHTIVLLATHIRMLTVIKVVAMAVFGITVFEFSEIEKLLLAIAQVVMVIPIIWLVNKYAPILDGKVKKT